MIPAGEIHLPLVSATADQQFHSHIPGTAGDLKIRQNTCIHYTEPQCKREATASCCSEAGAWLGQESLTVTVACLMIFFLFTSQGLVIPRTHQQRQAAIQFLWHITETAKQTLEKEFFRVKFFLKISLCLNTSSDHKLIHITKATEFDSPQGPLGSLIPVISFSCYSYISNLL